MNFLGNIKQKRGDHCCHQPSAARKLQDVKYCQTLRHIPCCFLRRGTEVFHQKSLLIAGKRGVKGEGGAAKPSLADEAGSAPWLQGRAGGRITLREVEGKVGVQSSWVFCQHLPAFTAAKPPRPCRDLQKGGRPLCVNLGTASPHRALLARPHPATQTTRPFCRSLPVMHSPCSEAHFPVPSFNIFFSQALSGCMEQQGPMQIPGTPPSPLIHCELPEGPPQALLHIGTPSHPLPLWSRTVCLRLCHLWVPFKKVGGNPPNADDCSGHA